MMSKPISQLPGYNAAKARAMDKQREQFEAWAEERGHDIECWPGEAVYKDPRTGNLWAAYKFGKEQAAQAAQAAPGEAVGMYQFRNRIADGTFGRWHECGKSFYDAIVAGKYPEHDARITHITRHTQHQTDAPGWNAAIEAAAKVCDEVYRAGRVHAAQDCAAAIGALAKEQA